MKVYIDAKFEGGNRSVETGGVSVLVSVMESMAARGVSMRPILGQIGTVLIGSVHKTFAEQGRPARWKIRSPLTEEIYAGQAEVQAMKTKRFQNAKRQSTRDSIRDRAVQNRLGNLILMNTGELRNSIMLGRVSNFEVEIGSSLIYARIQQLGGTITPKKAKVLRAGGYFPLKKAVIPARPYLGVQAEDVPVISRILISYLRGEGV